jgi:hypothetical protein
LVSENKEQLFFIHKSHFSPRTAVILSKARQSASAPWDILGV